MARRDCDYRGLRLCGSPRNPCHANCCVPLAPRISGLCGSRGCFRRQRQERLRESDRGRIRRLGFADLPKSGRASHLAALVRRSEVKYVRTVGTPCELGGKGYGLARLQAEGFLVPEWLAVSPAAFQDSFDNQKRRAMEGGDAAEIRAALENLVLSPDVSDELSAALGQLLANGAGYAVRSSAVDEDSASRSFAGQLESYLSVPSCAVA